MLFKYAKDYAPFYLPLVVGGFIVMKCPNPEKIREVYCCKKRNMLKVYCKCYRWNTLHSITLV